MVVVIVVVVVRLFVCLFVCLLFVACYLLFVGGGGVSGAWETELLQCLASKMLRVIWGETKGQFVVGI